MGNVQQSSPFVFHSFPAPSEPFAAEKLRFSRRLVPDVAPMNRQCGMEDESSMASSSSSIPCTAQINTSPLLPPRLTTHRTILQQLIELQDWQRVLCRLELYPDELHQFFPIFVDRSRIAMTMPSATNTGKRLIPKKNHAAIFVTPLHLVCALNPPLHVVATILRLGGPERASRLVHPATRTNAMHKKHVFWKNRRHRMLRSGGNNRRRHAHQQRNDEESHVSDSTPSMPSKWQILQSSSSDSSGWNDKINFRFSFDDYKRRVKYAIKQRRSRGGAFPIVEELNEDSDEEDYNENQYYRYIVEDSQPQLETPPELTEPEKIATAITADCSESHQSSISATPPRSLVSDQSVIMQLSSSGGLCPMPLKECSGTPSDTSMIAAEVPVGSAIAVIPKCKPLQETDIQAHSPFFRVQWDLYPLLRQVLDEGCLLPLHVAVLYSASPEVINALVDAYPPAALCEVCGMLPIHFVAAGWPQPPLLPTPAAVDNFNVPITNDPDTFEPIHLSGILQRLNVLQRAAPDSVCIRSGNNGMKPEEYINECMNDSFYKEACLRVCRAHSNVTPGNDENRLFDTSMTSSSDDIFDFNDTIHSSIDDCIERNLEVSLVASAGIERPFEYVSSLIAARDWVSVFAAIEMYPSLAAQWIFGIDDVSARIYKRLPLHCVCIYGGPIDLIEMLIKLYPEGVKTIDPTDLSTPLSLACFANCPVDTIRLILRAYPGAIDIVNVYGQAPLQVAILSKASFDVIETLVEEKPHLVLLKDNDGRQATDYAKIVYGTNDTVYQFLLLVKDALLTEKLHC